MGGVILLLVIITVVLCVVILCIKIYHKNKASSVDDRVSYSATKLKMDVPIEQNPSYDVVKVDNNTIKPGNSDDVNLYYNTPIKAYNKTSEDESNYAQPSHHSDLMKTIKMDTNPSYGISIIGEDITMDTNPSYGVSIKEGSTTAAGAKFQQSSYNATTKQ